MRHRVVNVELADGQEIRVADAPNSDPLRRMAITVAPLYDGPAIPAGGNVICKVFYGGGWGQSSVAYGPHYETGVQQGGAITLVGGTSPLPSRVFEDDKIISPDRWRDGSIVREDANLARALHLYNNTGGGVTFRCRVIFDSEELNEAF
jgi:hypothetical protein